MSNRCVVRWGAVAGCVLLVGALAVPVSPRRLLRVTTVAAVGAPPLGPFELASAAVRLRQRFAEWSLLINGITWRSNGRCSDRRRPDCTSFDGLRWGSIKGILEFGRRSGCRPVVSGGTERGHARGRFSHANGYKIDVMPSRCADRYIPRHCRHVGTRGDGAPVYRSPTGALYARESSHWDILFR